MLGKYLYNVRKLFDFEQRDKIEEIANSSDGKYNNIIRVKTQDSDELIEINKKILNRYPDTKFSYLFGSAKPHIRNQVGIIVINRKFTPFKLMVENLSNPDSSNNSLDPSTIQEKDFWEVNSKKNVKKEFEMFLSGQLVSPKFFGSLFNQIDSETIDRYKGLLTQQKESMFKEHLKYFKQEE